MESKNKLKMKKSVAIGLSLTLGLAITLFVIMLLFNVTDYGITIASLGASIFMILSKKQIRKRTIFGSYVTASVIGFLFSRLSEVQSLNAGLAAISSIILMSLLDFQHTPAVGMAIAMVLNKFSFSTHIIILLCIFFILGITMVLKSFMKDPKKVMSFISVLEIEEEKIKWNLPRKDVPQYLSLRAPKSRD